MRKLSILLAAICIFATQHAGFAQTPQKWFTTYYATWSMLPLGVTNYALPPWEIDFRGLTHVVLFDNGNITQTAPYWAYMFGPPPARPSDAESDSMCVEYNGVAAPGDGVHFTAYRDSLVTIAHRNGVKVVITIQAVNPVNLNYVTADSSRTQLLVNTLVAWAERKNFDGVELDWEGWATPLPSPDIVNRFMRILYRRVHAMKTPSGAPGLIMVSAGSGQQSIYDPTQDYIVDQFNLQLYDYAYAWYGKINSNAAWYISPLHRGTVDPTFEGMSYDTRGPLQWVAAGHDPKRIGLGVPTYGYILRNVDSLFESITNNGDYGSAHYQVIEALKSNGGTEQWDDARKVRSIHGTALNTVGTVSYGSDGINAGQKFFATGENPQSLQEKVNWMNANNFGGIMTYDFVSDLDPTQSIASGKRNPLQRVVASALAALGGSTTAIVPVGTFSASASTVPAGGGPVTLTWTSSNASTASIDQGVGTVALNGSTTVTVTTNKTFTLTLTSSTGAVQQYQATVTVNAPAPAGTLTASATSLPAGGGSVTLTWTSTNAATASIDQGVGTVALNGSTSVAVTASKTFCLTLTNSAGTVTKCVLPITVAVPAQQVASKIIYTDNALTAPWSMDGTYSTTFDFANTEKVCSGTTSIKFVASGWAGVNFRNGTWSSVSTIDPSQYDSLHMAINGGTTGAAFALWLSDASGNGVGTSLKFSVPANAWTVKSIPMSQFAAGTTPFSVIMLQLYQGTAVTFYIDDVSLVGKAPLVQIPAVPSIAAPASGAVNTPTSLSVVWSKSSGAVNYQLQLSTTSAFTSFTVNDSTLTDTTRAVSGLANGTTYYARVCARNTAGSSAYSSVIQFTTMIAPPAAPVCTAPANGATAQPLTLTLSWNASTNASSYRVQCASDSLFTAMFLNDSTVTSVSRSVTVPGYISTYYWRVNAKNASGTSAYSAVQRFTTAAYVKPGPYFTFTSGTGNNATVAISSSTSFMIGGSGLVAGDEIGAFTPAGLCVGAVEWNNANTALTVWGDNAQTAAIDGMRSGETIQFRVYRQATNTVYALVTPQYTSGNGMYQPDALMQLSSLSTATAPATQVTQTIALTPGWNMVGLYVKPNVTPIDSLTAQLMPNMTVVKNGAGLLYWPSMGINTLGFWNYSQGCMIYMANAATFTLTGASIQPEATPIALMQGWNLAPYTRTGTMNAATATASLGSALTIVKNNAGQVYWPAFNINTIGSMAPGQAYQMYVAQSATLLYPANGLSKTSPSVAPAQALPVHYPTLAGHTGDNEILLVKTQGLVDGDEIAVKTSSNAIVGTAVVESGAAVVTVWADESLTKNIVEGATPGQLLTISAWSKADGAEHMLAVSHISDGLTGGDVAGNLAFTVNGLEVVQTSIGTAEQTPTGMPTDYALMQNYPNPFNPSTVIRYALPADAKVTLELFTMLGEHVSTLVSETQHAGMHEVSVNAAGYASGVYFYVLKAGGFSATKRMTLLK